jgi:hypothetical protein
MANDMISKALQEEPAAPEITILPPSDTSVTLPGGYITATGEVITQAEIRELNGKDEEAISRASNIGKAIVTILQRGTVKIGDQKVDDKILDNLLSGDRDMLLLAIFKATFGETVDLNAFCEGCNEVKTVNINLTTDIPVKVLTDPISDRVFTVQGKKNEVTVKLPTGLIQKELITNSDKTSAELTTLLLEGTVVQIDGNPVLSKMQVQNLGIVDRRTIVEEIDKRVSGPQFDDLKITCPDCESEVTVPINLGALFQL